MNVDDKTSTSSDCQLLVSIPNFLKTKLSLSCPGFNYSKNADMLCHERNVNRKTQHPDKST